MWASVGARFGVFIVVWAVRFVCGRLGSFVGGGGFLLTLGISPCRVVVLSGRVVSVLLSIMVVIMWCPHLLVG